MEGELYDESMKEEEVKAGAEAGRCEVAFLSCFQMAYDESKRVNGQSSNGSTSYLTCHPMHQPMT